ncbi:MAG: sigma-70 family RNA polymerase sigma factor [Nannocystaceae bacterium]|nr:sigma-70 family RNA polymerase sigma factor [Nannocystaceae bacterium]
MDDFDLLDAWQQGDLKAGQTIVRRHYGSIFRFFFAKVDDPTCEDLTQTTFETLCDRRGGFRRGSGLKAFIFGIARNKLLAHLRAKRRHQARFDPLLDSCCGPAQYQTLTSLLAGHREQLLLASAVAKLPLDDQVIIELHDYEGLGRNELAEVFDVPPGTAASRLRRARIRLVQMVDDLAQDPPFTAIARDSLDTCMRHIRDRMDTCLRDRIDARGGI